MNLELTSQIAQILEGVTVFVAIMFGVVQYKQHQKQRNDAAATELMKSLQDAELVNAMRLLFTLDDGISLAELREKGTEYENAAFLISARFEVIGLVVYRGGIPLEIVEELLGGAVVALWDKLKTLTGEYREETGHPYFWEWFQWMAERFEAGGRTSKAPAYELE